MRKSVGVPAFAPRCQDVQQPELPLAAQVRRVRARLSALPSVSASFTAVSGAVVAAARRRTHPAVVPPFLPAPLARPAVARTCGERGCP